VTAGARPPLRVEQVLRILPEVDALAPLRSFLMATSRRDGGGDAILTVGKRLVRAADLPQLVPLALARVTEHLTLLYTAAIEGLAAAERGDAAASVTAFVRAADHEVRVGRESAARAWYEQALRLAEGGRDRRPEIATLQQLGALEATLGDLDRAARLQQRSLVLAEAEGDAEHAASAAAALGELALRRDNSRGAAAWFARGFEHAAGRPELLGRLALGMCTLHIALDAFEDADGWVRRADEYYAEAGHVPGQVGVLTARGSIAAKRNHFVDALALNREALVRLQAGTPQPRDEIVIRLEIARLYLGADRLPDAEDELHRAEEMAVVHNRGRDLTRVYILLGELRGRQRDESGFVYFENAIELSRIGEPAPRLEAQAYIQYAHFRAGLGDTEEARTYLARAREILEDANDPHLVDAIEEAAAKYVQA
jgi:tetratricopeptide (TPR) repeat protein